MTDSSADKTARLKPFKKGADSRRNPTGAMSRERAAWSNKFHNALAEKLTPEDAADLLIKAFKARQSWAAQEVLERLLGKVTQPVDNKVTGSVTFIMPRPQAKP